MSYNSYSGYGGNPYGQEATTGATETTGTAGAAAYQSSNPYGSTEGAHGATANPYGGQAYGTGGYGQTTQTQTQEAPISHQATNFSQDSEYAGTAQQQQGAAYGGVGQVQTMQQGATVLSNQDFLARVEAAKADIRTLTSHISSIASAHQRTLSSPDSGANTALESIVTQTQVLNTSIKDQIKFLETDAARSGRNTIKDSQTAQLKTSFKKQLEEYRNEEAAYERRYREQIARQYRIVNPEATEAEVQEASNADWGNEGVFQTALKTNRTATASTVLGAVRARHNDIQQIERTLIELNKLFEDLAEAVIIQEPMVQQAEHHTENVKKDTEAGNQQLDKGIASARRARKLKWWCFFIVVLIIVILALVLGLYFGLHNN